jgi:hypothetical protein
MGKLIIKNRYGTIPNDLLNSVDISFKAKGLYAYIQSKPDNWEFSAERIAKQVKEGLPSVVSALKELENFGYLVRKRYQNNKGFWIVDYLLYEIPNEENLYAGNPMQENPNIGNPSNISNIDFSKQEDNNYTIKKERVVSKPSQTFYERVLEFENLLGDEFQNFISYWEETDEKGKSRWKSQKFFNISRRISTWMQNKSKFNNNGNEPKLGTSAARMEALRKW